MERDEQIYVVISFCNSPSGLKTNPKLNEIRVATPKEQEDCVTSRLLDEWMQNGSRAEQTSLRELISRSEIGWHIYHTVAKFFDGTPVGRDGDWKHLAAMLGLDRFAIIVRLVRQYLHFPIDN